MNSLRQVQKLAVSKRDEFIKHSSLDWHFTDGDLSLLSDNEKIVLSKMLAKMLKRRFNIALMKNEEKTDSIVKQIESSRLFKVKIF